MGMLSLYLIVGFFVAFWIKENHKAFKEEEKLTTQDNWFALAFSFIFIVIGWPLYLIDYYDRKDK